MHFALLAATLAAGVNSTTPAAPAPTAASIVSVPATITAKPDSRSPSNAAVSMSAPKARRPAWEPPGYPLDEEYITSLLQSMPRSGDGGG